MVDSRQKGARAETAARDILRKYTKLGWERTPGSGALNEKHKLKGDLYIPDAKNHFCVEVKHYTDDHLTSKVLTSKDPHLIEWWQQAERQGKQVERTPLLLFKFDRSKWFVAFNMFALMHPIESAAKWPSHKYRWFLLHSNINREIGYEGNFPVYLAKLEDWLEHEDIVWKL